jgi:hypothetical protein
MKKLYNFLALCFSLFLSTQVMAQPGNTINYQDSFGSSTMTYEDVINGRNAYRSTDQGLNDVNVRWSGSQWEIRTPNNQNTLLFSSSYDASPNPPDLATGNWKMEDSETLVTFSGTGTQALTLAFTVMFDPVLLCDGVQTGLGGGTPTGGVYSGPGVTDDGNGMTFSFDPAAAGAGTQTISYGDANNTAMASIEVLAGLTVTANVVSDYNGANISCNGATDGEATAVISNGTAPFSYTWSNGQTTMMTSNLAAGTYTVTVTDANNCEGTASVTLTEPSLLILTTTSTDDLGGGTGTADASAVGGTSPYTYQWSNGQTGNFIFALAAGDYTVTVTDANGCTASSIVTVGGCIQPVINGVNITNCDGNNITLEVDGELNGASAWQWTATADGDCETGGFSTGASIIFTLPLGDPLGDATFYVRAAGGCIDAPVCFAYVVNDLLADLLDISFSAPGPYFTNAGLQPLTQGMPAGGTYSGSGVVDNGDGTFSFDPSIGAGTYSISYTFTSDDGCTSLVSDDIVVDECIAPVINGVELVSCNGNNNYTWQVNGSLNGAAIWEWTAGTSTGEECSTIASFFDGETHTTTYSTQGFINTYYVRAVGGCLEEPVCFAYVPNDLVAQNLNISFTAPGPFQITDGLQALTQGMPAGGTYSGDGVVDNGDGTYSFDPSTGAGTYTVTYSFSGDDGCTATVSDDIVVEEALIGDQCDIAIEIDSLFGQPINEPQLSQLYDNTDYSTYDTDPENGTECFFESGSATPVLSAPIWFTFVGDGNRYSIRTRTDGSTNSIPAGDTQMAIYTGDCGNLVPFICNEDEDSGFNTFAEFDTEEGTVYNFLIDGTVSSLGNGLGEYLIEVTQLMVVNTTEVLSTDFRLSPNPTNGLINIEGITPDQIRVNDSFGRLLIQSAENTNQIDLTDLPSGVYYIQVNVEGAWATKKVVKQ